jgi:beta-lactamase regulating signal transducer with metallopeptidase domain
MSAWLEALGRMALGGSVLVVLAALLVRWLPSAVGQRTLWRAVVAGLAILLLGEAGGLSDWFAEKLARCSGHEADPEGGRLAPRVGTLSRSESATLLPGASGDAPLLEAESAPSGQSEAGEAAENGVWWPGALWLAGTLILLLRGLLGRGLLIVFRVRHSASEDPALLRRVRAVAERLHYRRCVCVLEVPGLCGPVAFGIVRPTVAVPADFTHRFDASRQEVMLAHELAHLAARDPAWLLLADLVVSLWWWQPLAWWARQCLRSSAETAADESSLVIADGPALLASCLVELGTRLAAPGSTGWLGMAGNSFRSGLGRRVERLLRLRCLHPTQSRLRVRLGMLLAVAVLWGCAVFSTAWVRGQALEEGDRPMGSMQRSWRRSLAATFLLAVLAPANDVTPADEPPAPPAAGAAEPGKSPELDQEIQKLKTKIIDLDVLRTALRQRTVGDSTPIKELDKQIADLEAQKERLLIEQQEKALHEKHIRVFRLKHVKPGEVREALERLLGAPSGPPPGSGGPLPGGMPGMPGGPGMGPPGMMGPRGAGGKMPPMMPGPGGMMGRGAGGAESPDWRLTVDERTRSIIIRASRQDLQRAADVIALLDLPAGKAVTKAKNMRSFKLKHAQAAKIAVILDELGLDARVLALTETNRVIVAGTEAAVKEAAELIEQLDVDSPGGGEASNFDPFAPGR